MNIIIEVLRITDIPGKLSKTIKFKDNDNLITSEKNSRGKSVLMKSIYHTLGADSMFDSVFPKDNILYEITLKSKENKYRILRYKDCFSIIKNNELVDYISKGSRTDLSLFFQREFGTGIYLKNRKKTTELAPPAYLFIPYYLDQDRSWKEEQEPFSKQTMGQYETLSRNELYLYHLGVYNKNYGKIKSEIDELSRNINAVKEELMYLDQSYQNVKKTIDNDMVIVNDVELESFYRVNSNKINEKMEEQQKLLNYLMQLDKNRISCLISIRNNNRIIEKLKESNSVNSMVIRCPNCNQEFDIELRDEIKNVYSQVVLENENKSLNLEIRRIDEHIIRLKEQINEINEVINSINKEMIESRSNYEKYITRLALSSLLDKQMNDISILDKKLSTLTKDKETKALEIKEIKDKTHNAKIKFCDYYSDYLINLGVNLFSQNDISAFKKLTLSGSQYVRSSLAFYFAFLKVKTELNSTSYNFPLVIDSPREGEQDEYNSFNILDFILGEKANNYQRIVASVNAKNYITEEKLNSINVIELTNEEGKVMSAEEYKENEPDILLSLAYFKREN